MKKLMKRSLIIFLTVAVLVSGFYLGAYADGEDSVSRVSCCFYGEAGKDRGFSWSTTTETAADVQVVESAQYDVSFTNAVTYTGTCSKFKGYYMHKAVADNLKEGATYNYRVGDASQNLWSKTGTFKTDDGSSFSFIQIADVQASSDENFAHAAQTMKAAMATDPDAAFYTSLGDYVNDCTNDEWNYCFNNFEFANLAMTHAPVAGNHEGNLKWYWFSNMFNVEAQDGASTATGVYYSYDYGNAHFAVLNTNDMYPMSQQQQNWLINDMKASDAKWKILLIHRSSYSAGKNIDKPDTVIMRNVLIPLVDELGIDVVMAGHDHMYLRTKQVKNDEAVENVEYVKEMYDGEETTFAVNPDGAVNIIASTAGTKRYSVNENAIDPITDVTAFAMSTRDLGGCFTTVKIDGDRLVYKAYLCDDETQEVSKIDEYAIKKTETNTAEESNLPTDFATCLTDNINNLGTQVFKMLKSYIFKLVPQLIKGLF